MNKLTAWFKHHKLDVLIASALVLAGGVVSAVNMTGYPQRFEDEGTYISQAWAVEKKHSLTHYTYWYDHPPVGWIQIAMYTTATRAFERYGSAITAGREFMLVIHLATIVLLYALARRMKIGALAASLGVLAYALSPLVVEFSRYVLLDNVAIPWLLGAFLLALSPRRSLTAAIGSAFCMAIAILSKETFVILLPVLLYALWRNGDKRNRRFAVTSFGVVLLTVSSFYVLYAVLKNELLPGPGHVSLLGSLLWQVHGRAGSGSILDAASANRGLVKYWLHIDSWLITAGTVAMVPALFIRAYRPAALGLLLGGLMLLRSGYLPYPYIVMLLPFAALCLAGAIHSFIVYPFRARLTDRSAISVADSAPALPPRGGRWNRLQLPRLPRLVQRILAGGLAAALLAGLTVTVAPAWHTKLHVDMTVDNDASSRQAVAWVNQNVSRTNRVVVESALWSDLQDKGFDQPQPVWLYKTETDPAVTKEIGGWQGIDYIVLDGPTVSANSAKSFPTVYTAIAHSRVVAQFGQDNQKVIVYRVNR